MTLTPPLSLEQAFATALDVWKSVGRRVFPYSCSFADWEDLRQAGFLQFVKNVKSYNPARGALRPFAYRVVRQGAIKEAFETCGPARVPYEMPQLQYDPRDVLRANWISGVSLDSFTGRYTPRALSVDQALSAPTPFSYLESDIERVLGKLIGSGKSVSAAGWEFGLTEEQTREILDKVRARIPPQVRKEMLELDSPLGVFVDTLALREKSAGLLHDAASLHARMTDRCAASIVDAALVISRALGSGGKVLLCGNGGSAADAQHMAAEFVGRFAVDRVPYPAIALATNGSCVTAIANDYDYATVFERQVVAFCRPEDVVVGFSTSGDSENVVRALRKGRELCQTTIGFTGLDDCRVDAEAVVQVKIPSRLTPRIQEGHITAVHVICELVDSIMLGDPRSQIP